MLHLRLVTVSLLQQRETTNGSFSSKKEEEALQKKKKHMVLCKYKLGPKWPSLIHIGLELSGKRLSSPRQACHFCLHTADTAYL